MALKWSVGKILNQRPIDFNALDQDGQTAFVWTCKLVVDSQIAPESMLLAKFLLKQDNINLNFPNKQGRTGFHLACQFQIQPLVELIVSKSAEKDIDLNAKDKQGLTGFHLSCASNCNPDLLKYLLTLSNIDKSAQDKYGRSGLHLACTNEKLHNVQILMQDWDLLEIKDQYGQTAFHRACENGQCQVLKMLIQNEDEEAVKSMLEIKDKCGWNGLDLAQKYGKSVIQQILNQKLESLKKASEATEEQEDKIQMSTNNNFKQLKHQIEAQIKPQAIRNIA